MNVIYRNVLSYAFFSPKKICISQLKLACDYILRLQQFQYDGVGTVSSSDWYAGISSL